MPKQHRPQKIGGFEIWTWRKYFRPRRDEPSERPDICENTQPKEASNHKPVEWLFWLTVAGVLVYCFWHFS